MGEKLKVGGLVTGGAVLRAGFTATSVVLRDHRELAHRSITLAPFVAKTFDIEQKASGTNSGEWAADHRRHHHQFPDADLYPFWITAHAIKQAIQAGIDVPSTFRGYDRAVDEFGLEDVMKIGAMADEYLQGILGERHWTPDFSQTSHADIQAFLNNPDPKYVYDPSYFDRSHVYTDEEVSHILLRDQHAPALAPENADGSWNGVKWVFLHNTKLSQVPTRMYRQRPYLMPADLGSGSEEPTPSNLKHVVEGFLAFSAAAMLVNRKKSTSTILMAGVGGSVANGAGLYFLKKGGDIVNAFGHMGPMTRDLIKKAMFSKEFDLQPNEDGYYASDTEEGGFVGKFMSAITNDESGKQRMHHLYPAEIAYDTPGVKRSWSRTPFGTLVEKAADSKYIPFIQRGEGLPRDENGRRQDEAHPAIQIIAENRRRTMAERNGHAVIV